MGLWDSIAGRRGENVSGPVREAAEIQRIQQRMVPLQDVLARSLPVPIARFSNRLPEEAAELRGRDVYLSRDPGVFVVHGGNTLTAAEFLDLISRGTLLINTTQTAGYGETLGLILAVPGEDEPYDVLVPADYLVYDHARVLGISFDRTPEFRWLGEVLRAHAGIVKYLAELERARDAASRAYESALAGPVRKPRTPFPWARGGWSLANVALPGVGFLVLGDPLNALAWLTAVPTLAAASWLLTDGGIFPAALVWLAAGVSAARYTHRHWEGGHQPGERHMAVIPVAAATLWAIDRYLLNGDALAVAMSATRKTAGLLPEALSRLLYGTASVQYAFVLMAVLVTLASLAGRMAYEHWRADRYGAP